MRGEIGKSSFISYSVSTCSLLLASNLLIPGSSLKGTSGNHPLYPYLSTSTTLVVGTPLSFNVVDSMGVRKSLQQFRGKKSLLITFFPRCFTGNCTSQLTSIRDSYAEMKAAGIEVWAVSTDPADGPQGQKAFAKFLNLPFPLIPDTDRKISMMFGAAQSKNQMALRMSVFIDKNGVVRWIDKQIDPRNHARDVLARYKAEVAPQPAKKDEVKSGSASTSQKEPVAKP